MCCSCLFSGHSARKSRCRECNLTNKKMAPFNSVSDRQGQLSQREAYCTGCLSFVKTFIGPKLTDILLISKLQPSSKIKQQSFHPYFSDNLGGKFHGQLGCKQSDFLQSVHLPGTQYDDESLSTNMCLARKLFA